MSAIIQKGAIFYANAHFVKYYPWIVKAIERDHYRCVKCNSADVEKLIVHHIDESRKNGFRKMNNNLGNLITLCRSCHAGEHKQTLQFKNPNYQMINELRNQGKSFQQIGDYLGISRQRVHQIVKKSKIL